MRTPETQGEPIFKDVKSNTETQNETQDQAIKRPRIKIHDPPDGQG